MIKKIRYAVFALMPVIAFYLMEAFEHNPFIEVRDTAQFFNIILFELIAWILLFISGQTWIAIDITFACAMLFGLINHYVMKFRSTPFVPWDIYSVKTAKSVAAGYDFTPETRIVIVVIAFLVLMIINYFIRIKLEIKMWIRFMSSAALALGLYIFALALQDEQFQTDNYLYPFLFTPAYMTKVNGMAVTFTMDLAYINVDKPDGYDRDKVIKLLEEYDDDTKKADDGRLPNIIVIMDEAFSDLSILGDFKTNEDYMPFVHSLFEGAENTITGYANVSVCGGNTANSEFEFLTGNTMAFLPGGSIPYQQYIKNDTFSIAGYLKEIGYETYAQHPYYPKGWNRDTVYPLLGFDNMAFISDYINRKICREYISDESSFKKIIDIFENKESGKPAFIFNVTMQNHGSYSDTYDNFTNNVVAEDYNNASLDQYLSLIKITDSEFEKFISYFENVDEDTIIVLFGDHQPNDSVAYSILADNGMNYKDLSEDELKLRYKVPYVIWANFDIPEDKNKETSLNYLGAETLKLSGIKLAEYQNFLLELKEAYPVLSAVNMVTKDTDDDKLEEYKQIQYYYLFDQKGS